MSAAYDLDLFGNERPRRSGSVAAPVALSLLTYGSERAALASGRPVSQERAEIVAGTDDGDGPALWWCVCGGVIGAKPLGRCDECGA